MKAKTLIATSVILAALVSTVGVKPSHALGTPQIVSISPPSPAPVGTCVTVRARVDGDSDFRSMRIRFGNEGWQESSELEFQRQFCTNNYSPGTYTIRVEVAGQGDNSWSNPKVAEANYKLTAPEPPPGPSKGPNISIFSFSPNNGAKVGDSVNIHIKVDSNNPGATKINVDCGGVSKIETSEVEFDSTWNTNGCPAETVKVLVCARAKDDPNWSNATCTSRNYALSAAQVTVPVPSAKLWADEETILSGSCTFLHWETSNASSIDIDGDSVSASGKEKVCPKVTKKYTLSAHNQSGTANRNLTIVVSDQPSSSQSVADNFNTGDVIDINGNIYVIINGERRHVPNPDTLDALGISRNQVNNQGFSDAELNSIPQGEDIPDVNRDPSGFAAFRNQYFPNNSSSTQGSSPAPNQPDGQSQPGNQSGNQWQIGASVGLCAGAQIRSGSGFNYPTHTIVPENNWQVDIVDGPRYVDGVKWWDVSRKRIDGGGTGWVYFEQAGNCDFTHQSLSPKPSDSQEPQQSKESDNPSLNQSGPDGNSPQSNSSTSKAPQSLDTVDQFGQVADLSNQLLTVTGTTQLIPSEPIEALNIFVNMYKAKTYSDQCISSQDLASVSCGKFALSSAGVFLAGAGVVASAPVTTTIGASLLLAGGGLFIVDQLYGFEGQ